MILPVRYKKDVRQTYWKSDLFSQAGWDGWMTREGKVVYKWRSFFDYTGIVFSKIVEGSSVAVQDAYLV